MAVPRVVVTVPHMMTRETPYLRRLEAAGFEVVRARAPAGGKLTEDDLIAALPGTFATLASTEPYTERVFAAVPDLRVVARWGVGFDAVDVAAATRHGVAVCIAVGGNHESVADYAVGLMCALRRGLVPNHQVVREGRWRTEFYPGLRGATVGIVGLGRIGKAVARRCRAFGMRVIASEPVPDLAFVEAHAVELVSLEDLLRRADVVTLHCPLAPDTHHMIDGPRLALMKPTATLVNTARGPVVDEVALHEALATHRIANAGLDVFEQEPLMASPLFELDNVLLSPHAAGVDQVSEAAMADLAIDAILAIHRGERPRPECLLNPEVLARP